MVSQPGSGPTRPKSNHLVTITHSGDFWTRQTKVTIGGAENARLENAGTENARQRDGVENAGPENSRPRDGGGIAGPENAGPKQQGWKMQDWKKMKDLAESGK